LLLPLPSIIVLMLLEGHAPSVLQILVWFVAEAVVAWFFLTRYRAVHRPRHPRQPSVLTVTEDTLKIERAGRNGDLNISWQIQEIADIRLCPHNNDGHFILAFMHSPIHAMFLMRRDESVRVSVELPSGDVEDAVFAAPSGGWIQRFETRLRTYLGLGED